MLITKIKLHQLITVPIDFNQLQNFIIAIAKTEITELTIKEGDFELTLNKKPSNQIISSTSELIDTPATISPNLIESPPQSSENEPKTSSVESTLSPSTTKDKWQQITSPMVGTFYRASAPGESSFVEIGERISVGQVVCIIEAMKLMNEIETEINGKVVEIAVENGEPVEYGQTLIWIDPT